MLKPGQLVEFTSIVQEKEQHLGNWDLGMAFEPQDEISNNSTF